MTTHTASPGSKSSPKAQGGAALLVALIFLVVLTIIGIGVVGTTTTEEKLARNFRDVDIAFAAGEAGLRDAEIRINGYWSNPANPVDPFAFGPDCPNGLCIDVPDLKQPVSEHFSLTDVPSAELGTGTTGTTHIAQVSAQPRYLIESVRANILGEDYSKKPRACRITATGFGRLSAQVLLQETFRHGATGDPCW